MKSLDRYLSFLVVIAAAAVLALSPIAATPYSLHASGSAASASAVVDATHVAPRVATRSGVRATRPAVYTLNSQWSTTAQNARLSAINTLASSGFLDFQSGSQPATGNTTVSGDLLCSVSLGSTAFHAPSTGTMSLAGPLSCTGTADASSGTAAGYAVLYESDHTTVLWMGSVGTSSANITMATTTISTGLTVTLADNSVVLTDNASISGQ